MWAEVNRVQDARTFHRRGSIHALPLPSGVREVPIYPPIYRPGRTGFEPGVPLREQLLGSEPVGDGRVRTWRVIYDAGTLYITKRFAGGPYEHAVMESVPRGPFHCTQLWRTQATLTEGAESRDAEALERIHQSVRAGEISWHEYTQQAFRLRSDLIERLKHAEAEADQALEASR